jgi:hypothetical protein
MTNEQVSRLNTKAYAFLWLEWTILFILIPFVLRFWWQPKLFFAIFLSATVFVSTWLLRHPEFDRRLLWWGSEAQNEYLQLKRILRRFVVCGSMMIVLVFFVFPGNFFDMPREKPLLWSLVMILYPLLSVYPQELIYRTFFFERYRQLFPTYWFAIVASAVVFGFVHIIYQNQLAVFFTLIGGFFFAETYAYTRSLRLVWLEHALYGCLIFTIGLGEFFHHGRVG